ncbi:O-antigen chain length determinant [Yersinia intermedia]|uniref:Wzz/FepE/Etk N-terminal domain-containing protein n=1 Tax=Yersinia intermedia TaxID=631 RepID=UPI0005E5E673|nr:Wzz/FepE/Etk N-terminal domain-containing protein [Yersinia intermedia]CNI49747.1 O-antigen chain length determinant [Yersinia intermedia]
MSGNVTNNEVKRIDVQYGYLGSKKDEIDLIELGTIIAKSFKLIASVTIFFIFISICMVIFSQKKWRSSAIISPPSISLIQSLNDITATLSVLNIKSNIDPDDIFNMFRKYYSSQNIFDKYVSMQGVKFPGNVAVSNVVTDKKNSNYLNDKNDYIFTYEGGVYSNVKTTLANYIDYVNKEVNADVNHQIKLAIDTAKKIATEEYQLDLLKAQNDQKVRVQRLEYAVSIAKAAGLQKPAHDAFSISVDHSNYPISLGYYALNRQLKIERSITDLTTVNADLLNNKLYLEKIMALHPETVHIYAFNYLQQPSDPIDIDAKKRFLGIILFGFIGFVSSTGFVLVRHCVRIRRSALLHLPKE